MQLVVRNEKRFVLHHYRPLYIPETYVFKILDAVISEFLWFEHIGVQGISTQVDEDNSLCTFVSTEAEELPKIQRPPSAPRTNTTVTRREDPPSRNVIPPKETMAVDASENPNVEDDK